MKTLIYLFTVVLFVSHINLTAQNGHARKHEKKMQRLHQLEQLKLIDLLELDEDTSVRFFARKKAHYNKVKTLQAEKNRIINELSDKLKAGEKVDSKKYTKKLEKIERELFEERINFYRSLEDILTDEQIAKLIVFQSRFRKELMRSMMRKDYKGRENAE